MAIELLYGRGTLAVAPPAGCVPTVIHKHAMPVLADPVAAIARRWRKPVDVAAAGRAGARQALGLHPDLRHHPAGAERPLPGAAGPRR